MADIRTQYETILRIASGQLGPADQFVAVNSFAEFFGWQPNDQLEAGLAKDFARVHLLVEHGLQNTAVLTFLRQDRRFSDLTRGEVLESLEISYNNLVDWHVYL